MFILIFLNCNKLHLQNSSFGKYITSLKNTPDIDTSRPFRDPDRFFKAQLQYQNPYFELDIEQDEMGKLLFYQTGNLINSKVLLYFTIS